MGCARAGSRYSGASRNQGEDHAVRPLGGHDEMVTFLKVASAAVAGFLATVGVFVAYWASGFDDSECSGEECALEYAAIMTWSIVTGLLVGAVCGVVTYALTRRKARAPNSSRRTT